MDCANRDRGGYARNGEMARERAAWKEWRCKRGKWFAFLFLATLLQLQMEKRDVCFKEKERRRRFFFNINLCERSVLLLKTIGT